MEIVEAISVDELVEMSSKMSEPLVKGVVDISQRILAVDTPLHTDAELLLLEHGSAQEDLWGINLWPEFFGTDDFVEFDSMINIRPMQNNRTRSVDNAQIRSCICEIIKEKVNG